MKAGARLSRVAWVCLAAGLAAACEDPLVPLGPEHNMSVTNQPGVMFRFYANNLDNVIDDTTFTWVSNDSQATVLHRSLITHGEADVLIRDSKGMLIASSSLVYEADSLTRKGAPGPWTIEFSIKAATGKIDVTVEHP